MVKFNNHPLLTVARPVLLPLLVAIVIQIVASLMGWIGYQALIDITQGLAQHRAAQQVYQALGWLAVGLAGQSGLGAVALAISHFADARLQRDLRLQLADKLGRLPGQWFSEHPSGHTRQVIQEDVEALHQLVAHNLVEGVAFIMTPLVGLSFCFTLNWRLGLAACVPLALYFALFAVLSRGNMGAIMQQISRHLAAISGVIVDYVRGVAVLKVFGRAGEGYRRFSDATRQFHHDFSHLVRPAMRAQSVAVMVITPPAVALVVVIIGMAGIAQGTISAPALLVACLVAMLLPAAVMTVTQAGQLHSAAVVAARQILDLLNQAELPASRQPVNITASEITLCDVSVIYGGRRALNGINLRLPAGSFTALVGPSGAGKTTLARLLARQMDTTCGQVCIGGHDIRHIPFRQLYQLVGVLEQTPRLPAISLAQNIALGKENVPLSAIRNAAKAAQIDERIMALPGGYNAIPGIDVQLSGGEIQRVAIARLILADRPIVIMDEATSAIDAGAQALICQAIANLTHQRTTLAIAHRLETIQHADQIVVLDNGQISEQGSHEQLLQQQRLYARLWRQFSASASPEGV
ncbi:ABC transporter ATP-binding protein [Shimwellia pseudoproteus]|uniref:ABC transporter ATP-binding protein n=1 Tax=Shimwellia pseudoproteus TaxID=570012 RepID=UPI0018ECFD2F|nr:ABC transporter ATP-binding protein [Shimwellia pseudoproteus]MBJ3813667.1 ABC transporter ATP-binding protein [Shimwellia pseudoproteus]